MQCTNPLILEPNKMAVPCGKCRACRISRCREWATRMLHEKAYHENAIFITLTYRNENLPVDESISKDELQRFFKRLRKRLGERSIKYYASGEYGERRGRPHYHSIIFGMSLSQDDKNIIRSAWTLGDLPDKNFGTVTYKSCRYVANYIHKDNRKSHYNGRKPPFSLMSQGIGKQWAIDNEQYLKDNDYMLTIDGVKTALPKYYRRETVLNITTEDIKEQVEKRAQETLEFYQKKFGADEIIAVNAKASRKQKNKNIKAKEALYEKGRY